MYKKIFYFLILFLFASYIVFFIIERVESDSKLGSYLVYRNNIERNNVGYLLDNGFERITIDKSIKSRTPNKLFEIATPDWDLFFSLIKKHFYNTDCKENCYDELSLLGKNDFSFYIDKKGVNYNGSNIGKYSFGVNYENNRPAKCGENKLSTNNSDCFNLDIKTLNEDYIKKINSFLSELNFDYKYIIEDRYIKYSNTFNYNIKFIFENNSLDSSWYFDFGYNGAFSLQGFYIENAEKNIAKFSFITLEKAIEYYLKNDYLYNLIPDLESGDKSNKIIMNNNNLLITNMEIIYKKNIYDQKLYILPYYKITTDKGIFFILAVEPKK